MTLEELVQAFVNALSDEREGKWKQGDLLCQCIPAGVTGREKLLEELARLGRVSVARLRRLRTVALAWSSIPRALDKTYAWHAAMVTAFQMTHANSFEEFATMHVDKTEAELRGLFRGERVRFLGTCGECGFRVSVSCHKPGIVRMYAGAPVRCPVCGEAEIGKLVRA